VAKVYVTYEYIHSDIAHELERVNIFSSMEKAIKSLKELSEQNNIITVNRKAKKIDTKLTFEQVGNVILANRNNKPFAAIQIMELNTPQFTV
jgi:hypothetical protein